MLSIQKLALCALVFSVGSAFANDKETHFKEIDSNGDGKISAAEFDAAGMKKFTEADANKDGSLTKGELAGFMIDEHGKSGRKAEKKADKKISKLDANGDGTLTQQEFTDGHKKWFTDMDKNSDGNVDMSEMEKAHKM